MTNPASETLLELLQELGYSHIDARVDPNWKVFDLSGTTERDISSTVTQAYVRLDKPWEPGLVEYVFLDKAGQPFHHEFAAKMATGWEVRNLRAERIEDESISET